MAGVTLRVLAAPCVAWVKFAPCCIAEHTPWAALIRVGGGMAASAGAALVVLMKMTSAMLGAPAAPELPGVLVEGDPDPESPESEVRELPEPEPLAPLPLPEEPLSRCLACEVGLGYVAL